MTTTTSGRRVLTTEEIDVLRAYAKLHGRNWKAALRQAWMSASEVGILQQLRNDHGFGPSGLTAFKFPERGELAWYTVTVERTTVYEVQAHDVEDAKDRVLDGEGKEVDGETTNVTAEEGR